MNSASIPLLQVRELRKTFLLDRQQIEVLRGVHLTVSGGEFLSIMGASGVGKSTFLHLLGALDLPTSGEIQYRGRDISRMGESSLAEFRNREIGFVFQFHHLLPEFTAIENVAMPALIGGFPKNSAMEIADSILDEVGLGHRKKHKPGELSGGEQQRVAIARALIRNPSLILADEPTGNLDSKTSLEIFQLLRTINKEKGTTFILVTHNEKIAAQADRLLEMVDGMIIETRNGS